MRMSKRCRLRNFLSSLFDTKHPLSYCAFLLTRKIKLRPIKLSRMFFCTTRANGATRSRMKEKDRAKPIEQKSLVPRHKKQLAEQQGEWLLGEIDEELGADAPR